MAFEKTSVVVVGAGVSGLTAIKACLEEGHYVRCYEQSNDIGGVWKYREDDSETISTMFRNLYMNTSKEMSAFSDFPPPKEFPNYMRHSKWHEYLEMYATNFKLKSYIKFRHRIVRITQDESHYKTGRWKVQVESLEAKEDSKNVEEFIFDAVIVAAGQHNVPFIPTITGIEDFNGQVLHSGTYKKPDPFKDKRVLVYGFGNSAVDIATDLAVNSEKVYLSCKSTKWLNKRMGLEGKFTDAELSTRWLEFFFKICPRSKLNKLVKRRVHTLTNHDLLGLNPAYGILDKLPAVTETLPTCILQGMLELKPNIRRVTRDGVVFEGSEEFLPIDTIIFGTGFRTLFPFLSTEVIDVEQRPYDLYKWVFPIHLQHHTIAFLGLTVPDKAVSVVVEMEARWVARVFSNKSFLPTKEIMQAQTEKYISGLLSVDKPKPGHRLIPYVHCNPHVDDMASFIGAKPDMVKMALTNPKFFWKCFFGPCYSYQYRLNGPHSWDGARKAILTAEDRIRYPFWKDRAHTCIQKTEDKPGILFWILIVIIISIFVALISIIA